MKCKDCEYWNLGEDKPVDFPYLNFNGWVGECQSGKLLEINRWNGNDYSDRSGLFYSAVTNEEARMVTAPDFGCIHFK